MSLGSSEVIGFTPACPTGGWFQPVSLGLLAHALGVVGFIRDRWVNSRRHGVLWVYPGSFTRPTGLFVHSGSLGSLARSWWSLGSSGVVGFTYAGPAGRWVHPGCRWVPPRSLGSLVRALGVYGLIRCRWVR